MDDETAVNVADQVRVARSFEAQALRRRRTVHAYADARLAGSMWVRAVAYLLGYNDGRKAAGL